MMQNSAERVVVHEELMSTNHSVVLTNLCRMQCNEVYDKQQSQCSSDFNYMSSISIECNRQLTSIEAFNSWYANHIVFLQFASIYCCFLAVSI